MVLHIHVYTIDPGAFMSFVRESTLNNAQNPIWNQRNTLKPCFQVPSTLIWPRFLWLSKFKQDITKTYPQTQNWGSRPLVSEEYILLGTKITLRRNPPIWKILDPALLLHRYNSNFMQMSCALISQELLTSRLWLHNVLYKKYGVRIEVHSKWLCVNNWESCKRRVQ